MFDQAVDEDMASRLDRLGVVLPAVPSSQGSYVPMVLTPGYAWVSGQLPVRDGALIASGTVGSDVSLDMAREAAHLCAINVLAVLNTIPGGLESVTRVLRVTGYVAASPTFREHSSVVNGASDLLAAVFGSSGRHSRVSVGVASLPLGAPVEVDAIVMVAHLSSSSHER